MGMGQRARMDAARHQPGEMGHVDHEIGADGIGDLAEALEIPEARIGRAAGQDELRLVLLRQALDLVHVDALILAPDAIGHDLEPFARLVDRRAMGQMPARGEVQPHEGVAGLQQREEDRLIGLGAGMGLHIGEIAGEELLGALDGQRLGDIDELAAAVVAPARIALGIFVGQHRALGLEHRARDDVLRGDQLDLVLLPMQLLARWP